MPPAPGHPSYTKLNAVLATHGFDKFVEDLCAKFYHESLGRPGIPPGVYVRMLLIGYFEGVDATTLEANAAMRSIIRRDTAESYDEFLTGLAEASGIETPTREDLAKVDKSRKNKASNDDGFNPNDPDAKITKMKDGRTHLRGHPNILKRLLIHVAGFNLDLVMHAAFGIGKPRRMQVRLGELLGGLLGRVWSTWRCVTGPDCVLRHRSGNHGTLSTIPGRLTTTARTANLSTGC